MSGLHLYDDVTGAMRVVVVSSSTFLSKHVFALGANLVKTGPGTLHKVVFNSPGKRDVIDVYDGIDNTGTKLASITNGVIPMSVEYEIPFTVGLALVVSGTTVGDYTIVYE